MSVPVTPIVIQTSGIYEAKFTYTNYRGETAERHVRIVGTWFGETEYHPERQWFMRAIDMDKGSLRDFAMQDMKNVVYSLSR